MITFALPKGRIFDEIVPLLAAAGIHVAEDPEKTRKLIIGTNRPDVRLVIVRASDVPTYVQYGGADLGVVGKDTLLEHGGEGLYQPLDLNIAKCRMSVAVRHDFDYAEAVKQGSRIRVATKYMQTARDHFADKGVHVDLIKLYGSMELAPLTGLADAIVDLVSTGSTLAVNGLRPIETILESEALLISHPRLSPEKAERRRQLETMLASVIAARRKKYVMMNAPADALRLIKEVIPGLQSPTVMPLADPAMIAVHAVVDADAVWALLGPLKAAGATSILVMPIEKLIP